MQNVVINLHAEKSFDRKDAMLIESGMPIWPVTRVKQVLWIVLKLKIGLTFWPNASKTERNSYVNFQTH